MPRLHLNICLSDIPEGLIRKASNGKSYINLNVTELRETDEKGNDHTISVFVPQDRREEYPDKYYIGRGRELVRNDQRGPRQAQQVNEDSDLPF